MPPRKPWRLWPGVVAAILLLAARFGVKAVVPGFTGFSLGMMWSFGAAAVVALWWLLFSRARWFERIGAVVLMALGLFGAWQLRHESMGPLWLVAYALPGACLALVVGAVVARRLPEGPRRATVAAVILLACGVWTLVRTEGVTGDHAGQFGWRWAKSPEERLLAQRGSEPTTPSAPTTPMARATPSSPSTASAHATTADWPGFRGPARDANARGVRIASDWAASPPVEVWRRPIGPGWSSFAVSGGFVYTQEQRGGDEVVACYDAATGAPVWTHSDTARFFESNAGPGPRGTPTVSNGRAYALGATGILNALDAGDGTVVWSRDASSDSDGPASMADGTTRVPDWGFASSPLVVDDLVIVAVSGQLVAYDRASGRPRWQGPKGGVSYSSPHLVTIDGVAQVLLMNAAGATSVAPGDGQTLWQHAWKGFPIVQPAVAAEGDLLIVASGASGTRRIAVEHGPAGWRAVERWTSPGLKPYFSDFVVHEGHAFGFDGRILACIDLADGRRKWKGGRYGSGQLVLLPDQDLLLVVSEEGEVALIGATPDRFNERARFKAVEGKTWNHPALVGDLLLVRNGQEMVALRLARASD